VRAVEAKSARLNLRQAGIAFGAGELFGEDQRFAVLHMGFDHAVAFTEGRLHGLGDPAHLGFGPDDQAVDD